MASIFDKLIVLNPEPAFERAIKTKRLSDNPNAANFAGNFMYMYTEPKPDGCTKDHFKHIETREYLQ